MRSYDFFANVNFFFSNIPTHIPFEAIHGGTIKYLLC